MWAEFKAFISRGNVLDLAVAVIIGGAFGAIVNSLVNDIIMPLVGVIIGGINFIGLSIKIGESAILYGNFIQAIINFLIISFSVFLVVKAANKFQRKQEAAPAPPPPPTKAETLLAEIRDLLKAQAR